MKKKIVALALVIVVVLSLAACGKNEEPSLVEAPSTEPGTAAPEITVDPAVIEALPQETPTGVTPDSGVQTFVNEQHSFSFDYDTKYVAMDNQAGNTVIYAGTDTGLPFCVISVQEFTDAETVLKEMTAAVEIELEGSIKTKAGEPKKLDNMGERDIYYIYYTHEDKEAGGVIASAYYAENLEDSRVVVYNSNALESDTSAVDSIVSLALQSMKLIEEK